MTECTDTEQNASAVPLSAAGRPLPRRWLAIIATIWAGQAVSMVTSYAAGYAAVWYVTETTGSALALSLMTICAMLPTGLLAPFGGVVADRFNRKTVMIAADLGVGIVSLGLGLLILTGEVSLPLIALFAAARSVGQAFHSPAMMATLPLLVPDKHLVRINTLDQLLLSIVSIGAPAFGILLYTTVGFHVVMFLDFFGALAAVAGLMLAKIPTVRDEATQNQHVLANLHDGWRALAARRGLLMLMVAVTLGTMIFSPLSAVYPLMTYSYFGGDGYMASITEAAWGIGMIVGSGVIMVWGGGRRLALLMVVACVLTGVITVVCGLLPPTAFAAFAVLCGLMAVPCAWFNAPTMTLAQRNVPEEKLGRVMGLMSAGFGLASPVGVALGGALAEGIGVAPFFVVDGVLCIVLGAAMYLPRSIRALDAPASEGAGASVSADTEAGSGASASAAPTSPAARYDAPSSAE